MTRRRRRRARRGTSRRGVRVPFARRRKSDCLGCARFGLSLMREEETLQYIPLTTRPRAGSSRRRDAAPRVTVYETNGNGNQEKTLRGYEDVINGMRRTPGRK